MDPLFIGLIITVLGFFLLIAFAIMAKMQSGQPEMLSRVERLKKMPVQLQKEIKNAEAFQEDLGQTKNLFGKLDLRPIFSGIYGEVFFERLEQKLAQADIKLKPSEYLMLKLIISVVGSIVVYLLLLIVMGINLLPIPLLTFPIFWFGDALVLAVLRSRRVKRFSDQLAPFLILITNSLRAGQAFMQGCKVAAAESPEPISSEFKQVIKEVNLGMPEEDALNNLLIRVPSEDLKIVVAGYTIQRRVGGNLAEILEQTAETIRERLRIQGQLKALTTQGKLSGALVGSIPFLIGGVVGVINPSFMAPLIEFPGYLLIVVGLVLQSIGCLLIWKIVSIEV